MDRSVWNMKSLDNTVGQGCPQVGSRPSHEDSRSPGEWKRCVAGSFEKTKSERPSLTGSKLVYMDWEDKPLSGLQEDGTGQEVLGASTVHSGPAG